jgi:hypothetical protein
MVFDTVRLLSLNPILRRRYAQYMADGNSYFKREQCGRFMFDNQIDKNLFNRTTTTNPFFRLKH